MHHDTVIIIIIVVVFIIREWGIRARNDIEFYNCADVGANDHDIRRVLIYEEEEEKVSSFTFCKKPFILLYLIFL